MTTHKRDYSEAQFAQQLAKRGMTQAGFLGYVLMPNGTSMVSIYNAGPRRRDQLRYLDAQWAKIRDETTPRRPRSPRD